jgi:hypothetical protein
MTRHDDHFEYAGRIWRRTWTGDHYRWSAGNLAVGWNDVEPYDAGTKAAMLEAARETMREAA